MGKYKFNIGDHVEALTGEYTGEVGIIVERFQNDDLICDEPYYDIELSDGRIINLYECRIDDLPNYSESFNEEDEEFEIIRNFSDTEFLERTIPDGFAGIKLAVYANEKMTPHFHFYKGCDIKGGIPKDKLSGGGCICIKDPLYYIHRKHIDTLNSRQMKKLLKFLETGITLSDKDEDFENFKGLTNWDFIKYLWNKNNPSSIQVLENQKNTSIYF